MKDLHQQLHMQIPNPASDISMEPLGDWTLVLRLPGAWGHASYLRTMSQVDLDFTVSHAIHGNQPPSTMRVNIQYQKSTKLEVERFLKFTKKLRLQHNLPRQSRESEISRSEQWTATSPLVTKSRCWRDIIYQANPKTPGDSAENHLQQMRLVKFLEWYRLSTCLSLANWLILLMNSRWSPIRATCKIHNLKMSSHNQLEPCLSWIPLNHQILILHILTTLPLIYQLCCPSELCWQCWC